MIDQHRPEAEEAERVAHIRAIWSVDVEPCGIHALRDTAVYEFSTNYRLLKFVHKSTRWPVGQIWDYARREAVMIAGGERWTFRRIDRPPLPFTYVGEL